MSSATLSSKGQVTIPKEIRERLHLSEGDHVEFIVRPDGVVELLARTRDLLSLQGLLAGPATEGPADQDDPVAQAVVDEYERSLR